MALFPNVNKSNIYDGNVGKSHTGLVVSEGNAPSEKFIVSKDNDFEPFLYEFGPEGNQMVVIPKGKIVEAKDVEYDRETGYTATAIQVAEEESERVLGLNQHNIYDSARGEMTGGGATVITRNYVEVPLFEHADENVAKQYAAAMKFGAAYASTAEKINPGDYVVTGANGNFKKYKKDTHTPEMIVGQVWGATRELPPMGFLQYYMDISNKDFDDYIKQISNPASPGGAGYPYGAPYTVGGWKEEFVKSLGQKGTGIPFLTDGFFRAQERLSVTLKKDEEHVEAVHVNEVTTLDSEKGSLTVTADKDNEGFVYVKLKHKLNPRKLDGIEVTYTETDGGQDLKKVPVRDIKAIVENNTVAIYLPEGEYFDVKVSVDAVVNPIAGIPTEWDYAGSTGAVRILLQK